MRKRGCDRTMCRLCVCLSFLLKTLSLFLLQHVFTSFYYLQNFVLLILRLRAYDVRPFFIGYLYYQGPLSKDGHRVSMAAAARLPGVLHFAMSSTRSGAMSSTRSGASYWPPRCASRFPVSTPPGSSCSGCLHHL